MSEQLSFYKLFAEKAYSIEIPIIQRDYAQGRVSAAEIRKDFLDALYNYLIDDIPFRDLDFVYGNVDQSGHLIPLDGQQRLTTLFLLHWYLSLLDGFYEDFVSKIYDDGFSKFTYKTRQSSADFCNALLKNGISLDKLIHLEIKKPDILSESIKDSHWYFYSWDNDPTIQSMLCMLDSIHLKFHKTIGFYEQLTDAEKPVITFQFLSLADNGLTDDLYIKMNSRGKPLTKFENFKAKIEQVLEKPAFSKYSYVLDYGTETKKEDAKTYFSFMIDTQWAYLFWTFRNKKENEYDDQLMNFITTIAINNTALIRDDIKQFIDNQTSLPISFYTGQNERFITTLIDTFDIVSTSSSFTKTLGELHYYDEIESFKKIINKEFSDAGYLERIQFFAYYSFLVKWKGASDGFINWMRVVSNLSANTVPYNNETEFFNSIRSIDKLLPFSNKILDFLKTGKAITGFNPSQTKEERIKAHLITNNNEWRDSILLYEKHKYFNGQLTFALAFSGIEEYYDLNDKNCDWSETENVSFKSSFDKYISLVFSLFDDNGLKPEAKINHRLHRAVLSKGDYLLEAKSNYSFLIDKERDISWKRLLLGDGGRDENREYLKQVLDDSMFYPSNFTQLETIANNFEDNLPEWQKLFCLQPQLFDYLGASKYIRYYSEDSIYLLKGVRMNGEHAELYSLDKYLKYRDKLNIMPFTTMTYYTVSGETEKPCFYLDNWMYRNHRIILDTFYDQNGKYRLKLFDRKQNELSTDIIEILSKLDFTKTGKAFEIVKESEHLEAFLSLICNKLNSLT